MTILITGASGMVGLDLVIKAMNSGHEVLALYSHRLPEGSFPGVQWIRADVTKSLTNILHKYESIDVVIHCSAYTDVSRAELEKEKCYDLNVNATRNVRNLARDYGAYFIYLSTPFVFDGYQGNYREADCPLPLNFYASTKLIGEEITKDYDNGLIVRMSPIGMRSQGQLPNFVQWFLEQAKNNGSFTLFTDVRLNLLHTRTLADLILQCVKHKEIGILHLGSKDIANKAEIWDAIVARYSNFHGQVTRISVDGTEAGKIAKRPKEMWLNVDKALSLGYQLPSWQDELEIMLKEINPT